MNRRVVFAIPGDPDAPTGGYAYDRRMTGELRRRGWRVEVLRLPDGYPFPSGEDASRAAASFAALDDDTLLLVDGLAFGAMADLAETERDRLRLAALVHHPLALEAGLSDSQTEAFRRGETRALACARLVVATSRTTARGLAEDYGVPHERIVVAVPGTEPALRTAGRGEPPLVLALGSLVPRKGQDVLVEALALLKDRPWRCRIVGEARDEGFAGDVRAAVARYGLGDRIALAGAVPDARAEMADADVFALPTRYEGYGMVFAEALAHGLPVVACRVGAVPEVVPDAAGSLVHPGDAAAFAAALGALLDDPARRRRMAEAAFEASRRLPDWPASAGHLALALERALR